MTPEEEAVVERVVEAYLAVRHEFGVWGTTVRETFQTDPDLNSPPLPIIHSMKWRLKDPDHLRDKLLRKHDSTAPITPDNVFERITDLCGVRVLLLSQHQFPSIHSKIMARVESGDWRLGEPPVAYSWDPEASKFYGGLGLRVEIKESYYTSAHYLIRSPNLRSAVCVELQVRTLFEEVWGEVDHAVRYPSGAASTVCLQQIGVLARIVSAGSRLADSIFSTHAESARSAEERRQEEVG